MPAPQRLAEVASEVEWPDHDAGVAARGSPAQRRSFGRLAPLGEWLSATQGRFPPRDLQRVRAVVFVADHGIGVLDVSRDGPADTKRVAEDILAGRDAVNVFADISGGGVRIVDVGMQDETPLGADDRKVRRGSGRIDREDALTPSELDAAVTTGIDTADREIDGGADILVTGALGAASTTAAAAVVAAITDTEPVKVVGRGSGIDDDAWMRKAAAIRDARRRAAGLRGDPDRLLAVAGGADLAALAGFALQAARRRTPVILDGLVTVAGALAAHEAAPRAMRWWLAGSSSAEPAHRVALSRLGLDPILDLDLTTQRGCGALAAVPLLRAAVGALGRRTEQPWPTISPS